MDLDSAQKTAGVTANPFYTGLYVFCNQGEWHSVAVQHFQGAYKMMTLICQSIDKSKLGRQLRIKTIL